MKKKAIIIGAGPAGLTAAYELLEKTDIQPIIFESTAHIGGISKTIDFNGNKIDIGGHRFFSKSENIMDWWLNFLNLQQKPAHDDIILGRCLDTYFLEGLIQMENFGCFSGSKYDPECANGIILIRNRISRIIFNRKFFDYPVSLSKRTISNLGILKVFKIILSYLSSQFNPKNEISLEDFFINRFGKELYNTFFKDYTEKVWGVPCSNINPEWGAQRVKGLSITKTITHALKNSIKKDKIFNQKKVETSLIEQFLYPKFGPGQMWETVAKSVIEKGGEIHLDMEVCGLKGISESLDLKSSASAGLKSINSVIVKDKFSDEIKSISAEYFLSTMPVKDLIQILNVENLESVPKNVIDVSKSLIYRDFVTVGLLLKKLKIKNQTDICTLNDLIPDNWIYVQENDVKLGRIQIFNNWSPYMVKNRDNVWIGLEYFCNEGDEIWSKDDSEMINFALDELDKIGFSEREDFLEGIVIKMPKAYPAYLGSYDKFDEIRQFTDSIENLFLIGRNGMHRYNNMDHSMLTAMAAVDNICSGEKSKTNIWNINSETEYHESKTTNF
jgi:protoporphyrinogen oxidase